MSITDDISKRYQDDIESSAAYFFNQTSGVIDINNGKNSPSLIGAQEFIPAAYIALKEQDMDLRFNENLSQIADIMLQAFMGNVSTEQQAYIAKNQDAYKNALLEAVSDFDRLECVKRKKQPPLNYEHVFKTNW